MKKILVLGIVLSLFLSGCAQPAEQRGITNFEECVAAGNPVMESYPRQCRADGETFTEVIDELLPALGESEAIAIAEASPCMDEGSLTGNIAYNGFTKTWWIGLAPNGERQGCNPACVVSEETRTAEINWRCTGLLPD